MWVWIRHLAAQQTTAPELATFLLLVTVACVIASIIIYGAIMTIAWAATLKARHTWMDVVFPSTKRLREHAAEYVLAGLTSVILTLTLAEKDALVDAVLSLPARSFIDNPLVANIFPLERLPTAADLKGPSFRSVVMETFSTNLAGLVHGPIEAGRSEGVRAIFLAAAKQVLGGAPGVGGRVAKGLELLCFVMMAVYVIWLSAGRIRKLSASAADADDLQTAVAGRLVVLGVCLALLLANPLGNPSADLLADSAVAAARSAPAQSPRIDSLATRGIRSQATILTIGTMGRDDVARRRLTELADSLEAANRRMLALGASMAKALEAVNNQNNRVDLGPLTRVVDSLRQRALLLVLTGVNAPYVVRGVQFGTKGTSVGLHWLAPGNYAVLDAAGNQKPVALRAGDSQAIFIR